MEANSGVGGAAHKGLPYFLLALLELSAMTAVILLDLLIPSLLVLLLGLAFCLVRRERMPTAWLPKRFKPFGFTLLMLGWALLWTTVQYGLLLPLQNRLLSGTRDVDAFASVQGNLSGLLLFLLASWTLAALGEELAFRGFFQNRIITLFRNPAAGTVTAVAVTSLLFGAMHAEQGLIGVVSTVVDSVFFSFVRYRYKSVWASVLVHGFLNSIGLIAFYFAGPLYGLW